MSISLHFSHSKVVYTPNPDSSYCYESVVNMSYRLKIIDEGVSAKSERYSPTPLPPRVGIPW